MGIHTEAQPLAICPPQPQSLGSGCGPTESCQEAKPGSASCPAQPLLPARG